jgi:hypothetical protein
MSFITPSSSLLKSAAAKNQNAEKLPEAKRGPGFFAGKIFLDSSLVTTTFLEPRFVGHTIEWATRSALHPVITISPKSYRELNAHIKPEIENFDAVFRRMLSPTKDHKKPTAVIEIGAGNHYTAPVFRKNLGNAVVLGIDIEQQTVIFSQVLHQGESWYHPICADARNLSELEHFWAIRSCKIPCIFVARHQEAFFYSSQWLPVVDKIVEAMQPGEKFLVTSYSQDEALSFKNLVAGRLQLAQEKWWPVLSAPEQIPGSFNDGHAMVFVKPKLTRRI